MSETTPLIKAALNLRVGAGFDVYETCHAVVGNRKFSATIFDDVVKERNNGTAASGYIAITNDGEADILASGIGVGCDKQFIGH